MAKKEDVLAALTAINPAALDYSDWLKVGMALKHEGCPMASWDEWSRKDSRRYDEKVMQKKWDSFEEDTSSPIRGETIIRMAYDRGWSSYSSTETLDWNSAISDDSPAPPDLTEAPRDYAPAEDIIRYLTALFRDSEKAAWVVDAFEREPGKWTPASSGATRPVSEIVKGLREHPDDIGWTLGDYKPEAGAWVRINPMDGLGVKNSNVTAFRYALVESDEMGIEEQYQLVRSLHLPVAALVYSGGKSLHAICRIDAPDIREYRARVEKLYQYCKKHGFKVDEADKNPSRLSRLPGIQRGGKWQYLIETNLGPASWAEFEKAMETDEDLPPFTHPYDDIVKGLAPRPPELIRNILRAEQKLLITGPSKAGKTYMLIELAVAFAAGMEWMGVFPCNKARVLYINLELDENLIEHRLESVAQAMKAPMECLRNITFWNLRGYARPLARLGPVMFQRCQDEHFDVVIVDPIYKVLEGDENSANDMRSFCTYGDAISRALHAAVVYSHHHSKGPQGGKTAMDRGSGSGVFARDPDALLDVSPLRITQEQQEEAAVDAGFEDWATAWRISATLREFRPFKPVNIWFAAPLHYPDKDGFLQFANEIGSDDDRLAQGRIQGNRVKVLRKQDNIQEMLRQYDLLAAGGNPVTVRALAEAMEVSERTVQRYLNNSELASKGGMVFKLANKTEQT